MSVFSVTAGTRIRTSFTTTDLSTGALADPGVVTCKVQDPALVITTNVIPVVVQDGVGLFHLDVDVATSGAWTVEWIGSGSGPNVVECRSFKAEPACL